MAIDITLLIDRLGKIFATQLAILSASSATVRPMIQTILDDLDDAPIDILPAVDTIVDAADAFSSGKNAVGKSRTAVPPTGAKGKEGETFVDLMAHQIRSITLIELFNRGVSTAALCSVGFVAKFYDHQWQLHRAGREWKRFCGSDH